MININTQQITLYGRTTPDNITLAEAIQECAKALVGSIALLYSPTCCQFGKLQSDGVLQNSLGQAIALNYTPSNIFEARIFNEDYELRWLNKLDGKGTAVLISEKQISNYLKDPIESLTAMHTIPQTYLLWGKETEKSPNGSWGRLTSARIGALDVPVAGVDSNKRVYLKAREYLTEVDEYGNVAVVEERLIKLKPEIKL